MEQLPGSSVAAESTTATASKSDGRGDQNVQNTGRLSSSNKPSASEMSKSQEENVALVPAEVELKPSTDSEAHTNGTSSPTKPQPPMTPVADKKKSAVGADNSSRQSLPSLAEGDSLFDQIVYLGSASVSDAESEGELLGVTEQLCSAENACNHVEVTLTVATHKQGCVRLLNDSGGEVESFLLPRIRFVVRGQADSAAKSCFAFSYIVITETQQVYRCHAFKCHIPEAVGRVLCCFKSAFRTSQTAGVIQSQTTEPPLPSSSSAMTGVNCGHNEFMFEAFLEMKEDDGKGGFAVCPQEKNTFKLRRGREKRIVVVIRQQNGPKVLIVQKCFGLLLAAGRNVRDCDMQLLDMQSMGKGNDNRVYVIEALWDPNIAPFEVLNTETPRDTRVFVTVAADMVLLGVREPIRFSIECKARVFHQHERFWYITRRPVTEQYNLLLKKTAETQPGGEYEIDRFESSTQQELRQKQRVSIDGRSPGKMAAQLIHPVDDDESDSDEPLLSGSGDVCRVASEQVLTEWKQVLDKWKSSGEDGKVGTRPKELSALIRNGIPDVLRGEVWQLLAGCTEDNDLLDTYRLLSGKECPSEQVILRDIHRTFPAHEYFKEADGDGQDALLKLSKAYSLYDEEVGYCQGLSFLAASLLLHLPEERAFGVLVKIMFDYGMRDLFKLGFDALLVRFYQLERLIEDYIPDLAAHFSDLHIEAHMFASQWFLTLFTAKFPLSMVYHVIDLFLSEGVNTIFHISLALLRASKKELLQLDFEGVLKYFRVVLPRKYRSDQTAKELIQQAVKLKMSHKKLAKYEREYRALKQQEADTLDPLERLEREKLRLNEAVMRLERENDDLAHELVTSKIELRRDLDAAEDNVEGLSNQVECLTRRNHDFGEENKQLHAEYNQVRDMCRKEMQRLEEQTKRQTSIIANYKQICSDLSLRLEKQQTAAEKERKLLMRSMASCESCSTALQQQQDGDDANGAHSPEPSSPEHTTDSYEQTIRQLEIKLAETKLALVESQCLNQELSRQLSQTQLELDNTSLKTSSSFLKKTFSSIRDNASAALKQHANSGNGGGEGEQALPQQQQYGRQKSEDSSRQHSNTLN